LDSIDPSTAAGLRDRALIAVMVFSFARVSAVVGMNVGDFYQNGKRGWFRLHEKGGKFHEVPAHHSAEAYLDAYLAGTGIGTDKKTPLFTLASRRPGRSFSTAENAENAEESEPASSSFCDLCALCGSSNFQLKIQRRTVFQLTP
jgi:site-specific recombinase XerC